MTARHPQRELVDQLRGWTVEQVAGLLQRRPDLAQPRPPVDIAELAQRATARPSIDDAVAVARLPENRLLQVVVCCRPDPELDEFAQALPDGVGLDDVEAPLVALEAAALVWRHGGRVHTSATLRQVMPTTLGPPLRLLVQDQNVDYLKAVLKVLGAALERQGFAGAVSERAKGPGGQPPRKADLLDKLEAIMVAPGAVEAVLAGAPRNCSGIARAMAGGPPVIELAEGLYFSRYGMGRYSREHPTYWLFEHGMLIPAESGYLGVQPREVGLALRGGRPVADLALDPPVLAAARAKPEEVDASGAARAVRTLDRLADLLDCWGESPAKTLKTGGLGATVMKQTAAALEVDVEEATRLVELLNLAGLIETTTVTTKERRTYSYESFVGPGPAAPAWSERSVAGRWRRLALAWLQAEHWLSASGKKGPDAKLVPVLSVQYAVTAPGLRRQVLDVLAALAPEETTTPDALAAYVYWQCPQPWLRLGGDDRSTAIGWVYAEAELLGIVADGALTTFGRALLGESPRRTEGALEAVLPEAATTFTLQGDLTVTVVGALDRDLALELRLMADMESTGAATTLRFSDASLRRAFDAGRDDEAIIAFLEAHATKGVPKALAYLVSDVARRYGHLQVGAAASYVTSDDPAVLADACSHRRTRKLALRLVAPTVAVSSHPLAKVIDGLRQAGFLPTGEGDDVASVSIPPQASPGPGDGGVGGAGSADETPTELPEPFRASPRPHQRVAPALDAPAAATLAAAILAGPPLEMAAARRPPRPPPAAPPEPEPNALPLAFAPDDGAETPEDIDDLLEWAFENRRVLAIALGDADQVAEPMLVEITVWEPHRVVGMDIYDGTLISILPEHIATATDLGPADEVGNVAMLGADPRRNSRRRHRR